MCNMNSYESLSLGTVEGEVVKSVEVNTKIKSGASPGPFMIEVLLLGV